MKMFGIDFGKLKNLPELFRKWRVRRRRRRAVSAKVDLWVLRWLVMVPVLLLLLAPFSPLSDWKKAFFGSYFKASMPDGTRARRRSRPPRFPGRQA